MWLAIVLGTITLSVVQGCCLPRQLTMMEYLNLETKQGDKTVKRLGTIFLAVDADEEKTFSNISLVEGGVTTASRVIQDYSEGFQYVIKGDDCTKTPLGSWRDQCLPPTAENVLNGYAGLKGHEINVNVWHFKDQNVDGVVTLTDGCVPISEKTRGVDDTGTHFLIGLSFLNVTTTVPGGIFDLPDSCKHHARFVNVPPTDTHYSVLLGA